MRIANLVVIFVLLFSIASCKADSEPDTPQTRTVAAERYFKAVPFKQLMFEMTEEMAKQVPPERKDDFIKFMNTDIKLDVLESAAKQSFVKNFNVKEINAFAEFMEKPEGKSAMAKMKFYMADVMPVIQQEIARAVQARQAALKGQP
jgi:hypothetical protein